MDVTQQELEQIVLSNHECSLAYVVSLDWQPEKLWAKYENGLAHQVTGDELKALAEVVKTNTPESSYQNYDITLGGEIYTISSVHDDLEHILGTKGSTHLAVCRAKDLVVVAASEDETVVKSVNELGEMIKRTRGVYY